MLKHKSKDGLEREIFRIISDCPCHEACFNAQVSFYEVRDKEVCQVNDGKNTNFYVSAGNAIYPFSVKETVNYLKVQKA